MKKSNPKLIGAFVSLALVSLAGFVITLGTSTFFAQTNRFILFFDHSVNGLQVGSAAKFRGVPVGSVEQIAVRHTAQIDDSTAIPVIIVIDMKRLQGDLGVEASILSGGSIQNSIERGLAAHLNLESFITGQLFVEMDFFPDRSPQFHLARRIDMPEIPTIPSSMDQITRDLADVIANLENIDFVRLNENFNRILEGAADTLDAIDFAELNLLAMDLLNRSREILDSGDVDAALRAVINAADEIRVLAENIHDLTRHYDGEAFSDELGELVRGLRNTLQRIDHFAELGEDILRPGSETRMELEQTLREWTRAARSLRAFIQYIERNPQSILSGRDDAPFNPER